MARRKGEVYISETSSSSSESSDVSGYGDLSTSDEEYMRIIGGGDDDDEEEGDNSSNRSNGQRIPTSLRNEELQSIIRRIDSMEQSLAQTNKKLDIILQKLENKGDAQRY